MRVCVCVNDNLWLSVPHTVLTNTFIAAITSFEDAGMKSEECCDAKFRGGTREPPFYYRNSGTLAADSFLRPVVCVVINVNGALSKYIIVLK